MPNLHEIDTGIDVLRETSHRLGSDIKADIKARYLAMDDRPWIVAFSGGKDSTLTLQLLFEALQQVPPKRRNRPVYVLSSDTQVESPPVVEFLRTNLELVESSAKSLGLPVTSHLVVPEVNDTYFVRVIGYGYPPPSRFMRWCTDRLKIKPANKFILEKISEHGEVMILLGARSEESQQRADSLRRHAGENGYHKHTSLPNAYVYAPIREMTTDEVWAYLVFNKSPWGGDNIALRDLYKEANAGECVVVLDETSKPCGNSRFGCYTCTVVDKDKSLEGFVAGGKEEYRDLVEFRDWLVELRDNHENRMNVRRNGAPGVGPLKHSVRREALSRVLSMQERLGEELISPAEISAIRQAWLSESLQ